MQTIKITNLKNGTKTITGLTDGDMRLIASILEIGAKEEPQVSPAVIRLARALRTTVMFPGTIGNVEIVGGTSNAEILYEETANLSGF
jgi:hypothetical protein